MVIHNAKLVSTELSLLWTTYVQDSLVQYILKHFMSTREDTDLDPIINFAQEISSKHIKQISTLFMNENIPIPQAFSEQDFNEQAKKLFPDIYIYRFLEHMSRGGLTNYALGKATCARKDVRSLVWEWIGESNQLYDLVIDTMLQKGILVRSPAIEYPTQVEIVQKATFLTDGFLDEDRPLLAVEVSHLGTNIEAGYTVSATLLGFAQVAKDKKLRDLFFRAHEIAKKHIETFSSLLRKEDIHAPAGWDSNLTSSTIPPFSDNLMSNNVAAMISIGIHNYGAAMSASLRKDLVIHYVRLSAELGKYAEDLTEFMIKNQWLEKPPQVLNRNELIKQQKTGF